LSNDVSGATPETARETRAPPQSSIAKRCSVEPVARQDSATGRTLQPLAPSARHICRTKTKIKFQLPRGGIVRGRVIALR
jgi:hypothetical protein